MDLAQLDSRVGLGSDIKSGGYPSAVRFEEDSAFYSAWVGVEMRQVRVILGTWGPLTRLSAPDLDLVAEGPDFPQAWDAFLEKVGTRQDSPWLIFDVGPTRPEEISEGLDVPEDEIWSESLDGGEI